MTKKTVLITGAARGFGRALADQYESKGWRVFALIRNPAKASNFLHPIVGDVTCETVTQKITEALHEADGLDLLINNAGNIVKARGFERTCAKDLKSLFEVHCVGVLRCVKGALPHLLRAKQPKVANISSRWGSLAKTARGEGGDIFSYQIAKAAQNMLTCCMDEELGKLGVRVFSIHPGRLKTENAAKDADTKPDLAAQRLYAWIEQADGRTPCGCHDIMNNRILEW